MKAGWVRFLVGGMVVGVLPLLGMWVAGADLGPVLEFPPRTLHVQHAPFSWGVFGFLLVGEGLAVMVAVRSARRGSGRRSTVDSGAFPWWGWAAVAWIGAGWILAWTRYPWFSPLQAHTFTPLWLGYIVLVNALCQRFSGGCLLTREPGYLLRLFPVSAAFWWFFEYLNRFVQNWTYEGVASFSPGMYFVFATASFSTVLPAVMSTAELLQALGVAVRADDRPPRMPRGGIRGGLLAVSALALFFLGLAPNLLFPFLWLAPLGLALFVQPLNHLPRIFPTVGSLLRYALAALVCGFFWEIWNWHSAAKWVYHIPFAQVLHVFEMPLLGYFGYLPFGWQCAWLAGMVRRGEAQTEAPPGPV